MGASAREGFDPAAVLFEWDGVRRDSAPSREAGEGIAPCVTAGAGNGGAAHGARSGSAKDNLITPVKAFGGNNTSGPIEQAAALNANGGGQMGVAAWTTKLHNTGSNNAGKLFEDRTTCLDANSPPPALLTDMQVRRLTPRECERLQGFPETKFTLTIEVCEDEKTENAPFAALASASQSHGQSAPVAAHVLIDCERMEVRQLRAGRFNSSAPGAEGSDSSRLPMQAADSVRLAALTVQCVEQAMRGGKAASLPNISGSSRPLSGSAHVRLSGRVIAELAGDAERLTAEVSRCMKFITSQPGPDSQSFASTLETSLCCVAVAIVSCIQKPTSQASSLAVIVEATTPYTLIPWRKKSADECPDGPRYKALGNSWAVPVVRWIGWRIAAELTK